MIFHSVGGGTGSGFGTLLLERLDIEYPKKQNLVFSIYPSAEISPCILEPYNSVLATSALIEYADANVVFDNAALLRICKKTLDIEMPAYTNLNGLIS